MKALFATLAPALICFVSLSTFAWSNEADELREKAKVLQREAEELMKNGHKDEASKLARQAKELMQAANKQSGEDSRPAKGDIQELEQHLKALAQKQEALQKEGNKQELAELQEHRRDIERKLESLRGPMKHRPKVVDEAKNNDPNDIGRRMKHLHVAAENLRAAGMIDLANETAHRAEMLERELHERMNQQRKEHRSPQKGDSRDASVEELRSDVQQLRGELKEIRELLKRVASEK